MRPSLQVLSPALCDRIIDEARHILGTTGMEIRGAHLHERLLAAGLRLNRDGTRLLFPQDKIDEALATTPASFTLHDRAGRPAADIGADRVHFAPASSGLRILDHRTGQTRDPLSDNG